MTGPSQKPDGRRNTNPATPDPSDPDQRRQTVMRAIQEQGALLVNNPQERRPRPQVVPPPLGAIPAFAPAPAPLAPGQIASHIAAGLNGNIAGYFEGGSNVDAGGVARLGRTDSGFFDEYDDYIAPGPAPGPVPVPVPVHVTVPLMGNHHVGHMGYGHTYGTPVAGPWNGAPTRAPTQIRTQTQTQAGPSLSVGSRGNVGTSIGVGVGVGVGNQRQVGNNEKGGRGGRGGANGTLSRR
ncbi:hypothetical protein V8F20_004796 [Naviculisporaceae sp. PSN 640]